MDLKCRNKDACEETNGVKHLRKSSETTEEQYGHDKKTNKDMLTNAEMSDAKQTAVNKDSKPDSKPPNSNLEGLPVDRGWAWVILAGSVFYIAIFGGLMRSFGVFFLQFQERFKASSSEIALMGLIQNIIVSITGLLTMTIGMKKLSCRTVVTIGVGLNALSYIISGLATDIRLFYASHGLFSGAGIAMIMPPIFGLLGIYFNKHRGLANSIFTGSGAIGGLIFAPIVTTLFKEYGYTGAMIVVSGLLLNGFVSAALMKPPEWFTKRNEKKKDEVKTEASEPLLNKDKTNGRTTFKTDDMSENPLFQKPTQNFEMEMIDGIKYKPVLNSVPKRIFLERANSYHADYPPASPVLTRVRAWSHGNKRNRTISEHTVNSDGSSSILNGLVSALDKSETALHASGEGLFGSIININVNATEDKEIEKKVDKKTEKTCCLSLKAGFIDILGTVFDCTLLKNVLFIQYMLMAFVAVSGMVLIPVFMPTYAHDAGVSYDKIAMMIAVMACLDLVSKIITGFIADRKWIRRTTLLGAAALALGTLSHLARFFTSFPMIMALAVLMACFYGLYNSMYATILIDCIGAGKFQSSLGFVTLIHGISIAIFFPINGLLRDMYGSYIYSLHLCGCLCYMGSVLLFLLPVVQKRLQSNESSKENEAA